MRWVGRGACRQEGGKCAAEPPNECAGSAGGQGGIAGSQEETGCADTITLALLAQEPHFASTSPTAAGQPYLRQWYMPIAGR